MILREDENIKPMHYLRKSLIFFILLLFMEFSSGTDTLPSGKTLKDKDGDFLISVSKSFTLGFFSTEKSTNRYLGIYSSLDPEKRVVWVANRDKPVKDRSGVVSFIQPNYLALCVGSAVKKAIWSTTYLGAVMNNYSAQLLDTGNLIVFKNDSVFENDMERVPLWQSFDSPTDTWLPNMKLGFSRITAAELFLTSWKSFGDPRSGNYSFKLDPIREFVEFSLFKLNGVESSRIWRTGPLNGTRLVEFPLYNFNLTYLDDEYGFYMIYSMRKPSAFSYIHLNPLGLLRMSEWNPDTLNWTEVLSFRKGTCDDYNFCGPNSYCYSRMNGTFECSCFPGFEKNNKEKSRGCVRKRRDSNGCPNGEGFVKLSSMKIPDTRKTSAIEGLKDCEKECLRDCKCIAYIHATEMGFACVLWDGNLLDARKFDSGGKDLFVRIAAIELARNSSSNKKFKVAAVATSVGVVAASIGIFILCWHNRHKRKGGSRSRKEQGPANKFFYGSELFREMEIGGEIPLVDLRFLVDATNNFSDENKLGQGGFGSVYKGTLKDGRVIAVKRLSEKSGQGLEEFKNEATLIRRLQHRNLVRLLGCCVEQEEKIVIYEFMPNKSLNSLIFDKKEGSCLDWAQRFDIIMGITRGLVYLHHDSRLKIIHRDLKASNILLDAQMNPKISDFGMARFFANDEVEAITKRIVGTYGYMSPEYAMEGICSIKSDVYSFGILLLEIVSGRKNNSFYKEESLNLVGHVWKLWCEERALELIDPSLLGDYSTKTVLRCIHVGLLSVQLNADDRPTMFEIKEMLLSNLNLPPPGEPAFISTKFDSIHASTGVFTSSSQNTLSLSGGEDSVNYSTISVIVPR